MQYNNILVATAFSKNCERTLEHAKSIADMYHAMLHLVHFVEPLPASAFTYSGATLIDKQRIQAAKEKLAVIGKKFEIPADNSHLNEDLPKPGIIKLAKKLHIDLIVVGNHGESIFSSIFSCTANSVLHHSLCDILIVK